MDFFFGIFAFLIYELVLLKHVPYIKNNNSSQLGAGHLSVRYIPVSEEDARKNKFRLERLDLFSGLLFPQLLKLSTLLR